MKRRKSCLVPFCGDDGGVKGVARDMESLVGGAGLLG